MNTGKRVDEWNCTVALIPMLLIENSGQQRSTGAAVESFRNEMVKANEASHRVLLAAATNDPDMLRKQLLVNDNPDNTLLE
jgi:SpoVK/Ycf46/Vps4 family AAA+-type ATPase